MLFLSLLLLGFVFIENGGSILAEFISTPAHGTKHGQIFFDDFFVSYNFRVEENLYCFGMACRAAAYVLVGWVFRRATGVAGGGMMDSLYTLKLRFNSPESSGGEGGFLEVALVR